MRQERRRPRSKLLKKMSTPDPEAAMADSQEDRTGGCDFTLSDVHRLLMDVVVPMWITLDTATTGQSASDFSPGDLLNFYLEPGTTFTPA